MNQSGNIQKQIHTTSESENDSKALWVPNSLRNAAICLRGGYNIAFELLLLRFVSLLNRSGTRVDYVTLNQWLSKTLQQAAIVNQVINEPNPNSTYVMDCTAEQLLPLLRKQLGGQFPLPIFLTPEVGRCEKFSAQWLKDLPPPYIGISWDIRSDTNSTSKSASIDLHKIIEHVSLLTGTLVVLQSNVTPEELKYIGENINASLLDCSDLHDEPEEMLAVMDLLDDYIGVPDLAQTLRASVHKPAHVFWPLQLTEKGSLWNEKPEELSQWFPDARLYCQSSTSG